MKNSKKIKTFIMGFIVMCVSFTLSPQQSIAANQTKSNSTVAMQQAESKKMISRLYEINAIDKSILKPEDKKILRNELLQMKSRIESSEGGGVYISVGGILLILLLIIIIF